MRQPAGGFVADLSQIHDCYTCDHAGLRLHARALDGLAGVWSLLLALPGVVGFLSIRPAFAQVAPQQQYMISIGTAPEKVASGTIWLYSFSYYGLQMLQLATIQNGLARVSLDTEKLKHELDPHPNAMLSCYRLMS